VSATLSLSTLYPELARVLEPRAAQPRARLAAIEALARAGVPVGVNVAPVIPGLNDHEIPAIVAAAAAAGAGWAAYILLRLPHSVKGLFESWLEDHRPDRRSKVLAHVRETRGGKLSDRRFSCACAARACTPTRSAAGRACPPARRAPAARTRAVERSVRATGRRAARAVLTPLAATRAVWRAAAQTPENHGGSHVSLASARSLRDRARVALARHPARLRAYASPLYAAVARVRRGDVFGATASCHSASTQATERPTPAEGTRRSDPDRRAPWRSFRRPMAFIDGGARGAHGADMPVWGRRFDDRMQGSLADETKLAPGDIYLVVEYLRSIQRAD
jgi:hypothetical protein